MKQLTIISGKGGTGKTTMTAAFATLFDSHVVADCDVDAADLHLILEPTIKTSEEFYGGKTAVVASDKCQQCDECVRVCRFDAIENYTVDPISCEGCGVCVHACPEEAITMEKHVSGHWSISQTRSGYMTHAKLGIAEENSGKLVTLVRQEAKLIAERDNKHYIIIDGPPGIGGPVIAGVRGDSILVQAKCIILSAQQKIQIGFHDQEVGAIRALVQRFQVNQGSLLVTGVVGYVDARFSEQRILCVAIDKGECILRVALLHPQERCIEVDSRLVELRAETLELIGISLRGYRQYLLQLRLLVLVGESV